MTGPVELSCNMADKLGRQSLIIQRSHLCAGACSDTKASEANVAERIFDSFEIRLYRVGTATSGYHALRTLERFGR